MVCKKNGTNRKKLGRNTCNPSDRKCVLALLTSKQIKHGNIIQLSKQKFISKLVAIYLISFQDKLNMNMIAIPMHNHFQCKVTKNVMGC